TLDVRHPARALPEKCAARTICRAARGIVGQSAGRSNSATGRHRDRTQAVSPPVPLGTKIAEVSGDQGSASRVQERSEVRYSTYEVEMCRDSAPRLNATSTISLRFKGRPGCSVHAVILARS